jgi:phosphate acetyltransferase
VLSPFDPVHVAKFADEYARLRAHKGVTVAQASDTVTDVSYFGTMMVHLGLADGMVSGAAHTTAHTIRPAFEIIKTQPGVSVVSSVFLMALADRVLVYGDCAVIPTPPPSSWPTSRSLRRRPRRSSASTRGSRCCRIRRGSRARAPRSRRCAPPPPSCANARHSCSSRADPVRRGRRRRRRRGEDARIGGRRPATVFIFPDLNTGNNTYKAVQRSAGAVAIGRCCRAQQADQRPLARRAGRRHRQHDRDHRDPGAGQVHRMSVVLVVNSGRRRSSTS